MADPSAQLASYPQWKAPGEDGRMLIWPGPAELLEQTRENHRRLGAAEAVRIGGVALPELRRVQRQWLGFEPDRPLIATGHQTELYHPGVWVKNLLIHHAAAALDGESVHFAVDTDEPKHLQLQWLGGQRPITDDPAVKTAAWAAAVAPPTPGHVDAIAREFDRDSAGWGFEPLVPRVLGSIRRQLLEAGSLPAVVVSACHELDWELGLRHHAMIASPMWYAPAYLALVGHVLGRAEAFAADYNAALAEYRQANGIGSRTRPMPDLAVEAETCEVPFWLDRLDTGTRARATVRRLAGGRWGLATEERGDAIGFDSPAGGLEAAEELGKALRQRQLRLSPRALTLTLFLRLVVVDQFVHGIGGGRYDQVLDRLIARHFGIRPPYFSVTTATLYAPQAQGRARACLPCVLHEGHGLRHRLLGEEKRELVGRIEGLPRRSPERLRTFMEMHRRIEEVAYRHPALAEWEERLAETHRQLREDEVFFNRELFYAMQPRERLAGMIERYGRALGA